MTIQSTSVNKNLPPASPANLGAGASVASSKALAPEVKAGEAAKRQRRPMSAPTRRLETTKIPGYHLHWIREQNIPRAQEAGYEFVRTAEVSVNHRNVSVPSEVGSTADLSDRVSVQYGGDTLYLLKLEESLYQEDMAAIAARNVEVWEQIFRGEEIVGQGQSNPGDTSHRYVKQAEATGGDLARAQRSRTPLFGRKFK